MKCMLSGAIFLLALHTSLLAADPATRQVQFDGHVLNLASAEAADGTTLNEYIPEGETLDHWTRLASIREYEHLHDPKAVVVALLENLKEEYPDAPSAAIENPKTGEVIVDFLVWPPDGSFVEFNVFKYQPREGGGLIAQQYALRAYEDSGDFLKGLRPVRDRLVELMAEGLQPVGNPVEVRTGSQP